MNKIPYIVSSIVLVLTGLFAILNKFWSGFAYFVLSLLLLLSLFWAGWLLFKYFTEFKAELEEKFEFYKADKINNSDITEEIFENNEKSYKKNFSKHVLKDKFIKWFQIALAFALAVAFFLGLLFM